MAKATNSQAAGTAAPAKFETPSLRYGVEAVERALAILDVLAQDAVVSQAEIARAVELSEATVLRYLATLGRHGFVERDSESGRYRLGAGLFHLGQKALVGRDLRSLARPYMRELLQRFGETVNLAMRWRDEIVLIDALEGTRSLKRGASVGERDSWHASSVGKAILAGLPEPEARRILASCDWDRKTRKTHRRTEDLVAELAQIRQRGYAVDDEEGEDGLRCVGTAILDQQGVPSFAISVSGPATRLTPQAIPKIGKALMSATDAISGRLGHLTA
jgi:IclR family transcriptional regulator, acetate operon repressor